MENGYSALNLQKLRETGFSLKITEKFPYCQWRETFSRMLTSRLIDWLMNSKTLSRFQTGFVKEYNTDNMFVIRTKIGTK
jgi:hypothetical protein